MKHFVLTFFAICLLSGSAFSQETKSKLDSVLPVRGLSIAAPSRQGLDVFLKFINDELAPAHFNLLILRVDFNYAFESFPNLRDKDPLTKAEVKKMVAACKKHGIRIAPHINLLGHQSWAKSIGNLLREYPDFDETPHVNVENYSGWPNPDGLYCKSYCPLHPEVHKVVFALIDELMDVYETDLFHAGMDEVFYIGDDKCPRCSGLDKAELFAGEVSKLAGHIANRGGRLMIWGDRLIDGKTTGIGAWEASMNQTARAIDLIPKDVFICDWHYERADLTSVMFAMKGLDVATCPWRKPEIAVQQLNDMLKFRENAPKKMSEHFQGIIETVWSGADGFLKQYYDPANDNKDVSDAATLKRLMAEYKKMY
ncbi:MAG: family 20 glycosylhydrolase [Dysgonamonadaceae bacterium]|jgi:hypothetical protein|nr:family 20 glycosylhydrolase [Dysgonamonadaceae bacterium]